MDVYLTFYAMNFLCNRKDVNKFIVVSGDGDYLPLVKHLVAKDNLKN